MLIEITQRHIDKGEPEDCASCPIAMAINEKYPNHCISVSNEFIYIESRGFVDHKFVVPKLAKEFIAKFDAGMDVQPFSFNLV